MTDKPIIFSAPMVQALLTGRKTQTRRLLKPQPAMNEAGLWVFPPEWSAKNFKRFGAAMQCPADAITSHFEDTKRGLPYAPGDRLYVREAALFWRNTSDNSLSHVAAFKADGYDLEPGERWRPSIFCPRWASRLTLTVTEVRVQRLQEISEADAVAEGVAEVSAAWQDADEPATYPSFQAYGQDACFSGAGAARLSFMTLWSSLHGPDAWATNPWVVAVSFAVQNGNIDAVKPNA